MATVRQEFFPKDPKKTYGLMELMKGTAPLVGKGGPEDTFFAWPHLLVMELIAALGVTLLVVIVSILVRAPLRDIADPDKVQLVEKAPWYFLNIQELLRHMNPALAGVIVPNVMIGLLAAIPYVDRTNRDVGVWFSGKKGAQIALFSFIYATVMIMGLVVFNEKFSFHHAHGVSALFTHSDGTSVFQNAKMQDIVVGQAIPTTIMVSLMVTLALGLWKVAKANTREVIIGLFSGFVAAYFVLIIIGLFFRGPAFSFISPLDLPPGALSF